MSNIFIPPLQVPSEIELEDGWLTWTDGECVRPPATDKVLQRFVKLESDASILKFAQRYGVLGATGIKHPGPPRDRELQALGYFWTFGLDTREPLTIWHELRRQARAMLRIAACLQGRGRSRLRDPGKEEDWTIIGVRDTPTEIEDSQAKLMLAVNEWLRIGNVGLRLGIERFSKRQTRWRIEIDMGEFLSVYHLFGHLAYQMFVSIAGSGQDKLYVCSACGYPYIRTQRPPNPGQDNYCEECSGIAALRASQRWKAKNRRRKNEGTTTR